MLSQTGIGPSIGSGLTEKAVYLRISLSMLNTILNISQVVLAVMLVAAILLQARGTGLGGVFGGEGNVYRTKRGLEKRLFHATVIIAILFFAVSIVNVLY